MLKKYLTLRTDDIYGWLQFALVYSGLVGLQDENKEAYLLLGQRSIKYALYMCERYHARNELAELGYKRLKPRLGEVAESLELSQTDNEFEKDNDADLWTERVAEWKSSKSVFLKHCEWLVHESEIRYKPGVEIEIERLQISE